MDELVQLKVQFFDVLQVYERSGLALRELNQRIGELQAKQVPATNGDNQQTVVEPETHSFAS